jgi:hypothetical protein
LEVVRYASEHSEKNEPDWLRFDVIQDPDDSNRFYFCGGTEKVCVPFFPSYIRKPFAGTIVASEVRLIKNGLSQEVKGAELCCGGHY